MSHEILINVTPQETRVAVLEQGIVQELHMERASARGLVGNICLGRVARVLPGMQSAFIEIGLERAAFLHIADIWEHRQNGHGGSDTRPIEKILHEGQALLVQVVKDPIGTKGARLSTQVSLAGRLLVFLPQDSHIGISQRIEDETERETLRERLQQLLPEGLSGGFIIRTMAETATLREMQNDITYLTKLWSDLNARAREVPAPSLLYQDLSLAQRVLRDMATEETTRIVVDSRETFVKMQEFAREYTPTLVERVLHHAGDRPLFDLNSVEDEIEKALARSMWSSCTMPCSSIATRVSCGVTLMRISWLIGAAAVEDRLGAARGGQIAPVVAIGVSGARRHATARPSRRCRQAARASSGVRYSTGNPICASASAVSNSGNPITPEEVPSIRRMKAAARP